jgi:hypothetical protein
MTSIAPRAEDGRLLRLSVVIPGEEFDLEVPAEEAIQAWLPDMLELLIAHGMLTKADASWAWYRTSGAPLAEAASLRSQGVTSGQRLWFGVPPQSRVRLISDGYGRRRGAADAGDRPPTMGRMLGAIAIALAIAVHLAVLVSPPAAAAVTVAGVCFACQFGLFRWFSSSSRFAERTSPQEWEVFAASVFVSAALLGIEIGRVSSASPLVFAAVIAGAASIACLLTGIVRRWQSVFWATASAVTLLCGVLVEGRALTGRQGIVVAMVIAVVLAASSHRVARAVSLLPGVRRESGFDERAIAAESSGPLLVSYELISRPQRLIDRARLIQGAVAAAALVIVISGAMAATHDPLSLSYSLVCLFALVSCAWTANYEGRALTLAGGFVAAAYLIGASDLTLGARCVALLVTALVSACIALDAAFGRGGHATLTATLVRLRAVTIIAVFALLAAELNGWVLAWQVGARLGRLVF